MDYVDDDDELAGRFAAGEPDTIRSIYERYGRLVYSVAYKVLGDAGLAEDATQQTFVQAWQAASRYDPARSLGPWLARIARHAAIDVYRRNRQQFRVDDLARLDRTAVDPAPSAEQLYEMWEVRRALLRLSDPERELIRLLHFREFTHVEIAEHLGLPVGTVKSRSFRAHRRLAGLLGHLRSEPHPVVVPGRSRAIQR
ncbi:MAG TPA: sigma-70 family RNA polymerase sigma factor [Jatrophihabitans sp.]|nr:sigma-70 family RNA polymerase sigma factor [Jatrophihabitans sp.]